MSGSDAAHLARVRDNQRRSRARRKEYLQEVEGRLRECEQTGVAASAEIQAAARTVALENSRLRLLLIRRGVSQEEIRMFLNDESFSAHDDEIWAADQAKTDDAKILDELMKNGGTRSCGPGDCGKSLSVSYPHPQEVAGQERPKLACAPDVWGHSPTNMQHCPQHSPQTDMLRPQTSHSPASITGSIRHRLAPASHVTSHMTPESSGELQYQPRIDAHQPLASNMAPTTMPIQTAQILASMPGSQNLNETQYGFRPQPLYPSAQPFQQQQIQQPQQLQQNVQQLMYQPPKFHQVDYTVAQAQQPQESYGQGIGTNSCVYATDLITSVALDAHPADIRTDLGCSAQGDDCEVDNRTVFDVMDRYTGIPQA